jgi:hypothetical protein
MPEKFCTLRAEELKDQFFDRTAQFPAGSTVFTGSIVGSAGRTGRLSISQRNIGRFPAVTNRDAVDVR